MFYMSPKGSDKNNEGSYKERDFGFREKRILIIRVVQKYISHFHR